MPALSIEGNNPYPPFPFPSDPPIVLALPRLSFATRPSNGTLPFRPCALINALGALDGGNKRSSALCNTSSSGLSAVGAVGSAIYARNGLVDRVGEAATSGVAVGAGLGSLSAGERPSRGPAEYVDVGDAVPFICAA